MTNNPESAEKMRLDFHKYAMEKNLLHIGRDNLATCVQNLDKHRADFYAGWKACNEQPCQQPMTQSAKEELAKVILNTPLSDGRWLSRETSDKLVQAILTSGPVNDLVLALSQALFRLEYIAEHGLKQDVAKPDMGAKEAYDALFPFLPNSKTSEDV